MKNYEVVVTVKNTQIKFQYSVWNVVESNSNIQNERVCYLTQILGLRQLLSKQFHIHLIYMIFKLILKLVFLSTGYN